jgi:hypothetical protein
MTETAPPTTRREPPALPLALAVGLAVAVWLAGWLLNTPRTPRPSIRAGSVSELVPAIRAAPRAVVYVGSRLTTYGVHGRGKFLEAAEHLAREHPGLGVQFFVIEEEADDDAVAWGESFNDSRLLLFGHLGYGWVLWLEHGRIRDVEPCSGNYHAEPPVGTAERTLALWSGEAP